MGVIKNKIDAIAKEAPVQRVEEIEINRMKFDVDELERKAKMNEALTAKEHAALDKYHKQELSNRILRIVGLISILCIITLAVGCFLYPYSLLNVFGEGDGFWNCWKHVEYHLGDTAVETYYNQLIESIDWADPYVLKQYGSKDVFEKYFIESHNVAVAENGEWESGWLKLEEIMAIAFQPGTGAKCSFIMIGSWSIVVLSTIGLVGTIVYAIYAVSYNIKDLINLLKHLIRGTKYIIDDVGVTVKEQTEEALADIGVTNTQPTRRRATKPKQEKPVVAKEKPKYEPTSEDLTDEEESDIQKKIAAYKEELEKESSPTPEIKSQPVKTGLDSLSDDDLNNLLR